MKYSILFFLLFQFSANAISESEKTTNKRGYWWGEAYTPEEERDKSKEISKQENRELPPPPPMSELMKMHPEDIRELEKKHLDYALWKLTPEATEQYYTILKAVRLKAKAFAATHGIVKMTNPNLNTSYEIPQMAAGRDAKKRSTEQAVSQKLSQYKDDYGLIMFTSRTCSYCPPQRVIINEFSKRYGLYFQEVDINDNPQAALKFTIKNTPTIILVKRNTDKWLPVTYGLQGLPYLRDNSYRSIMYLEKEITPRQFYTPPNLLGTNLDPDQHVKRN